LITIVGSAIASTPAIADHHKKKPVRILITNVSVWDGTSDKAVKGMDVLVEGNKVKFMGKGIKPRGAVVIDGQGGTVTPGLIDMHQHLTLNSGTSAGNTWYACVQGAHASRAAEYMLRSGFTTIRDIAGNVLGMKKAINEGILPGPRMYVFGQASGPTAGHSDWNSRTAGPGAKDYQQMVGNTHVVDGRADDFLQSRSGEWQQVDSAPRDRGCETNGNRRSTLDVPTSVLEQHRKARRLRRGTHDSLRGIAGGFDTMEQRKVTSEGFQWGAFDAFAPKDLLRLSVSPIVEAAWKK
jgi:hypothetical protein